MQTVGSWRFWCHDDRLSITVIVSITQKLQLNTVSNTNFGMYQREGLTWLVLVTDIVHHYRVESNFSKWIQIALHTQRPSHALQFQQKPFLKSSLQMHRRPKTKAATEFDDDATYNEVWWWRWIWWSFNPYSSLKTMKTHYQYFYNERFASVPELACHPHQIELNPCFLRNVNSYLVNSETYQHSVRKAPQALSQTHHFLLSVLLHFLISHWSYSLISASNFSSALCVDDSTCSWLLNQAWQVSELCVLSN